jgi:hypothetical protein
LLTTGAEFVRRDRELTLAAEPVMTHATIVLLDREGIGVANHPGFPEI